MRKIKRDDSVIVIAGRDKGKRGDVLSVKPDGRLLVGGVNVVKKHSSLDQDRLTAFEYFFGTGVNLIETQNFGVPEVVFKGHHRPSTVAAF